MIFSLKPVCMTLITCAWLFGGKDAEEPAKEAPEEAQEAVEQITNGWDLKLHDFFIKEEGGTVPLTIYARAVNDEWKAAVGSSRSNFEDGQPPERVYNLSFQHVDMSGLEQKDGKVTGPLVVHMTPDLWVPRIGRSFPITFEIDAEVTEKGNLEGSYTVEKPRVIEPSLDQIKFEGGNLTSFT